MASGFGVCLWVERSLWSSKRQNTKSHLHVVSMLPRAVEKCGGWKAVSNLARALARA